MSDAQTPEVRSDVVVVTPDNFAQYVDEKMGIVADTPEQIAEKELAALTETKASTDAAKIAEEDPTHDAGELPDEKKKGINERFSKLSAAKRAAEEATTKALADAKAATERAEKVEQEAAELRNKYEPKKTEQDPEPRFDQFKNLEEYTLAVKEWSADNALRQREKQIAEDAKKSQQEKTIAGWNDRQAAVKVAIPDYAETLAASDLKVSNEIRDAVIESDIGPEILYHLAKNPEIVAELNAMAPAKALIKFGRLEVALTPSTEKPTGSAKVVEVSKAPAPITPLKGSSSVTTNGLDAKGEFHGTADEWRRLRQSGKIK